MKHRLLEGSEIAGFIKERQSRVVRGMSDQPCMAIVRTNQDKIIDTYLRLKQAYAEDIGARVEIFNTTEDNALELVSNLNARKDVHGIIIQLPLADPSRTEELLNAVSSSKDIDGLAKATNFDPATPTAILWLLASYNIDLIGKNTLVVGRGRLVGAPLIKMLTSSGLQVKSADDTTDNILELVAGADVIITATGSPHTITSSMVSPDTVIVDAGIASEKGVLVGDVDNDLRERSDISITPLKGGVGPLTICALFENLILASTKVEK